MKLFMFFRALVRRLMGEKVERWSVVPVDSDTALLMDSIRTTLEMKGFRCRAFPAINYHAVVVLPRSRLGVLVPDAYEVRVFECGGEINVWRGPARYVEMGFALWMFAVLLLVVIGTAISFFIVGSGESELGVVSIGIPLLGGVVAVSVLIPIIFLVRALGFLSAAVFREARMATEAALSG